MFLSTVEGIIQVHAIRPAYIVIAGLGAGNILLVVIAIVIICSYPLNVGRSDRKGNSAGGGGYIASTGSGYDDGYEGGGYDGGYVGGSRYSGGYDDGGDTDAEHHEMTEKYRDDEDDYRDDSHMDEDHQQPPNPYHNENEINDKRFTASSYDDEPPANVEENPYFNNSEMQASAAL